MCKFHYPYYCPSPLSGSKVQYIGNVDNVEVSKIGCYKVGHTGSFAFYWDGQKSYSYMSNETLPYPLYWKDEHPRWGDK